MKGARSAAVGAGCAGRGRDVDGLAGHRLNNAWRYVFMSRVRQDAAYQDQARLADAEREWNRLMGILEQHLAQGQAYMAGAAFSLADVVIGLSLNRWLMTPFSRPDYPELNAYLQRLKQRPGFLLYGANGLP